MSQKMPLVVVSGATGAQGGSAVNSLLATGNYKIRGLTRNPGSDKAKALAAKGVEVVKCDLSVKEDVKKALKGADIALIVTNFWDKSIFPNNVAEEEKQGKMIADVAKEIGLNWLIFSSLPDSNAESGGKYPEAFHFNGKNHVEQYIRTLGIPNISFIYLGFYCQNVGGFIPLAPRNGEIDVAFPYLEENDLLPMIDAVADTGPIVAKIIEDGPSKWNGKKVPVAAEYITTKQMADVLTKVTGKPHKARSLSDEDITNEFTSLNSNEFKQMYKWFKEYGYFGKNNEVSDISIAKRLHPNIKTFEKYILEVYGKK